MVGRLLFVSSNLVFSPCPSFFVSFLGTSSFLFFLGCKFWEAALLTFRPGPLFRPFPLPATLTLLIFFILFSFIFGLGQGAAAWIPFSLFGAGASTRTANKYFPFSLSHLFEEGDQYATHNNDVNKPANATMVAYAVAAL